MYLKGFLSIIMFSVLIISCGETKEKAETSETPEKTEQREAQTSQEESNTSSNTMKLNNVVTQTQTPTQKLNLNDGTQMKPTTPPGMNPPHGQPGHDCKIPVGQPLDGSTLNKTTSSTPVITNNNNAGPRVNNGGPRVGTPFQNTSQPTKTAPGMNPPHGQPGHDCSIPVGQPLKK